MEPPTGVDLATSLGLASKKEVNPGLYKMEKEGTVVRAGMQKARPLWKLVGQESSAQDGIAQEDGDLTCRKADVATQTSVPPGNEEKELS